MRYVTVDELLYINARVLNNARLLAGEQEIRDIALLDAAAQRPQSSAFGQDAYPSVEDKAAALLHSIARNHPFADGNKRTAVVAALFMLEINGRRVRWDPAAALRVILQTAQGDRDAADLAAWLETEPCPESPTPEAAADIRLIDGLIDAHRWLLDELDRQ